MQRTRERPLASGAIAPVYGLIFGIGLAVPGVVILACTTAAAAGLAVVTLATYLLVYTPMKRRTHFATAVGGIPGAIPPVIGWTAVTGSFGPEAYVLFLVVFLWQMPHFLALGWMYRKDYAAGGYKLLPSIDATGEITARIIMVYSCALLPASVLPFVLGMTGIVFVALVGAAWVAFMIPVYRLVRTMNDANARKVFHASLIYIPAFFASIGIDRLLGL
jgi:protoheme IX farnesyltransferase